jgi:hypothetical protein
MVEVELWRYSRSDLGLAAVLNQPSLASSDLAEVGINVVNVLEGFCSR